MLNWKQNVISEYNCAEIFATSTSLPLLLQLLQHYYDYCYTSRFLHRLLHSVVAAAAVVVVVVVIVVVTVTTLPNECHISSTSVGTVAVWSKSRLHQRRERVAAATAAVCAVSIGGTSPTHTREE